MYQIRPHNSERFEKRQHRQGIEISSSGQNIPLQEEWQERWCTLPKDFENVIKSIYEFEVKADDVFVVTFPKCGTTWLQEAAWLLLNDLNYKAAEQQHLTLRSAFIDLSAVYCNLPKDTVKQAAALKSPRLIKTHLPAHLVPQQIWKKKTKIIYCARNPKDVIVSYYHFHRGLGTWQGDLDEFVEDFLNDDIMYTPYWPSLLAFWKMRNESNIFFTTFEEMKHDLKSVLKRMNAFLNKPALSEAQIQQLLKHLSFDNMKANKCTNLTDVIKIVPWVSPDFQFMRRGIVGSYKDELSVENQQKLNEWTKKCLKDVNIVPQDIFGAY